MNTSPVILFTYNRPDHTRLTVEALQRNTEAQDADLFIFSDGPKNTSHAEEVKKVRAYLRTIGGFKSINIVERESNIGLAASVIAGVTAILERHPSCIVVEDDMLSAPNFLQFMNSALTTYKHRPDIFSVTGYNYPLPIPVDYPEDAYLSYRGSSWGWGTWADRWDKVDWDIKDFRKFSNAPRQQALFARGGEDLPVMLKLQMEGKLDSWSIRFDYAHYKHNAFCLHAVRSKIQNIGFDGSGTHCGASEDYSEDYGVELDMADRIFTLKPHLQPDRKILEIFDTRFRPQSRFTKKNSSVISKGLSVAALCIKKLTAPLMRYIGPSRP